MKSNQQEQVVSTSCKDCIFAIYEDKPQTVCFAQRIVVFKKRLEVVEAYDDEKEFYVIKRLCNLNRSEKTQETLEQELKLAQQRIAVSIDLFIDCSNVQEENIDNIVKLIENYDGKVDIILMHGDIDIDHRSKVFRMSQKLITKHKLTCPIINYIDYDTTLHSNVQQSRKSFHVVLDLNDLNDDNILNKVNTIINKDMEKCIIININDNIFISNLAYKVQSFNNTCVNYTEVVNSILEYSKEKELYKCLPKNSV